MKQFKDKIFALSSSDLVCGTVGLFLLIGFGNGYFFEVADQHVLFPKGMNAANPALFANDWFVQENPQPHLIFDQLVSWAFAKGVLYEVSFILWCLSVYFHVSAALLFQRKLIPSHSGVFYLSLILLVIGPLSSLGAGRSLLYWLIPHGLAGGLIMWALGHLAHGRSQLAALLAVPIFFVHYHFALIYILILMGWHFLYFRPQRKLAHLTWVFVSGCVLFGIFHMASSSGLTINGAEMSEICEKYTPGHCFARLWPLKDIVLVVPTILLSIFLMWSVPNPLIVIVGLPLLGLVSGIVCDYFDIPYVAQIVRQSFIYRLSAVTYFFCCIGLAFVTMTSLTQSKLRFALGLVLTLAWGLLFNGELEDETGLVQLVSIASLCLLVLVFLRYPQRRVIVCVSLAFPLVALTWQSSPWTGFSSIQREYSEQVAMKTSLESVVVVDPNFYWLRLLARRSLIVDGKAIPYGGRELREWERRMTAVRTFYFALDQGSEVAIDAAKRLIQEYKATHFILNAGQLKKLASLNRKKFQVLTISIEGQNYSYLVKASAF